MAFLTIIPLSPLKNMRALSRGPEGLRLRQSPDDLLDKVFKNDNGVAPDFFNDDIPWKPKTNAASGNNQGVFLGRGIGGFLVYCYLDGQIIGLEILHVLPVPRPALSPMEFPLTFGPTAGLLPLTLPWMGRKPPAANLARPLSRSGSFHRALFAMGFESTIVYRGDVILSGV
jgi:hypothetical protein